MDTRTLRGALVVLSATALLCWHAYTLSPEVSAGVTCVSGDVCSGGAAAATPTVQPSPTVAPSPATPTAAPTPTTIYAGTNVWTGATNTFQLATVQGTDSASYANISHAGTNGAPLSFAQTVQIWWNGSNNATIPSSNNALGGCGYNSLTESSATGVLLQNVAVGTSEGGRIEYTVWAGDGTDNQARHGSVQYAAVNKAGTETCVVHNYAGTADPTELTDGSNLAASSGTLTYTWACSTSPTNGVLLTLNAVTSLTQTGLFITYTYNKHGATGTVVCQ
jgi:hypothetical protein